MQAAETEEPRERQLAQTITNTIAALMGRERVGLTENILQVGMHSLFAVHLVTQLSKATGCRVEPADIIDHPTPEALGIALAARAGH